MLFCSFWFQIDIEAPAWGLPYAGGSQISCVSCKLNYGVCNIGQSSSQKKSKSLIKPIAPKEYDGQADARSYYRFVKESGAYLRDGWVKKGRQVFLLSYYLTGKAYDFYTQNVALNDDKWTLKQFYEGLFDHCFPINYQMQLRRKLAKCHLNDKTVTEYIHELLELFNMIGDVSEQDRVQPSTG